TRRLLLISTLCTYTTLFRSIWSRLDEKAIKPYRDTRPYVGLKPTTPLNAAGCRIEPPVSEPKAAINSPEATAAAGPPEEPPGTRSEEHTSELQSRFDLVCRL